MATIYAMPDGMEAPSLIDFRTDNGRFDAQAYLKAEDDFIKQVQKWAKEHGSGDLAGEVVTFPVADGQAVYIVVKNRPLSLIHVTIGDGYSLADYAERGLRVTDIRKRVEGHKALTKLFTEKAKERA